ncbi:MAG: hypothetical protein Q9213_001621 [Squamulea squamosa]
MTAAVCLFCVLDLSEPWKPLHNVSRPLIIYSASGAVGSFAIQLARLSKIHPIIAVAGNAKEHVEQLIDSSKGDVVCDYRNGNETLVREIQKVLGATGHQNIEVAQDCISEEAKGSHPNIIKVLHPRGHICLVPNYDPQEIPPQMTQIRATVRWVHQNINSYAGVCIGPVDAPSLTDSETGCREFGYIMFRFFTRALEKGLLKGHPYKVAVGGLGSVQSALEDLKAVRASGIKYVVQIADTPRS